MAKKKGMAENIIIINKFSKVNLKKEKKMEKVKNMIFPMVNYILKENIRMEIK